jgi:hypothetical protein
MKMIYEDRYGKIRTEDELDELSAWEIDDLGIHTLDDRGLEGSFY